MPETPPAGELLTALANLHAAALDARPYLLNAADAGPTPLELLRAGVAERRLEALDGAIADAGELL